MSRRLVYRDREIRHGRRVLISIDDDFARVLKLEMGVDIDDLKSVEQYFRRTGDVEASDELH